MHPQDDGYDCGRKIRRYRDRSGAVFIEFLPHRRDQPADPGGLRAARLLDDNHRRQRRQHHVVPRLLEFETAADELRIGFAGHVALQGQAVGKRAADDRAANFGECRPGLYDMLIAMRQHGDIALSQHNSLLVMGIQLALAVADDVEGRPAWFFEIMGGGPFCTEITEGLQFRFYPQQRRQTGEDVCSATHGGDLIRLNMSLLRSVIGSARSPVQFECRNIGKTMHRSKANVNRTGKMNMGAQNMKAMQVDCPNAPFRLVDIPRPAPGPGQVLVRIHASGVNPLDAKIRAGAAAHAQHPLPAIISIDMAGVVEDVGAGVSRFKAGDVVYGMTGGVGGVQGSLAEFAAVDADLLAIKPANLSMREAAALPLAVITAWEGLVDRAKITAGQTVLVQGGSGGVGHMAVQIARAFGAEVFATGRAANAEYIGSLGATLVPREMAVAEQKERFTAGKGFELVYDTVGGAVLDASFEAVATFGHVVSCLGWGAHALAPLSFKAATYSGVFTLMPLLSGQGRAHHGEILAKAAKLAEAGRLQPKLDPRSFAFAETAAAHDALAAGAGGRLVINIV
jgi:NADPH2:quinone reductase